MKREFDEIQRTVSSKESLVSILRQRSHFKPFLIGSLLLMGRSACGRSPLEIFANDYLKSYHTKYNSRDLTVLLSSAQFVVGFTCSFLVGKYSRKRTTYVVLGLLMTSLVLLIVYSPLEDAMNQSCPWFPLPFIFLYTCGVTCLLFPLLGLICVETISSSNDKRSTLLCVTYLLANIVRASVTAVAPIVWNSAGFASLLSFFFVGNVFCLILVKFFIPETNNKALHECVPKNQ